MPRWSPIVLALAAALCLTSPASAFTYGDTLTTIWRPLPNLPTIARPGDTFTVWANAPIASSNWDASLQFASQTYPLTPVGGGWQASRGRWELDYQIPAGVPEEIYDLNLSSDLTGLDIARHSVKVIPQFLSDFYFAQISDTHLPTHLFSSDADWNPSDTTSMGDFNAVIADLNVLHPQFILHSGDLVNEGELEEFLGMFEMGRALGMLSRLYDPIYVSSGNHDIGGWEATPPPDGTARKNWWRYYGWPYLASPPAGIADHSQDFSFDYGLLHVIGLEAYINSGAYDSYLQNIWGTQSFTAEQMGWLAADVAAVPAGHSKLAFYHYDFTGSQINPASLGLNGAIWGHVHGVSEGNRTAQPFNLGLQAICDGRRTFRVFRVHNGVMSPGPMHHSGTSVDSLTVAWSGPNDGTSTGLTATVTNRFGETWDHAQLHFVLADDDSFTVTGGTMNHMLRSGGVSRVYVDFVLPASGTAVVSVTPTHTLGVDDARAPGLELESPSPNPYAPPNGTVRVWYSIPSGGAVRLAVFDLGGRRVATLYDGQAAAGRHPIAWDGRGDGGRALGAGVYLMRLTTAEGERSRKFTVMR